MLVQLTKSLNNNSFVTNDKGEIEGLYYWDGYQYIKYNLEPGTSRITSIEDNYESSILESAGVQMYGKHVGLRFADFGMVYEKSYYLDYGVDTTLIGGTKSGSEDSSFNTLLMCVSFYFV